LAQHGLDVLVLEEDPVIGEPVDCSGVIGREAFDVLELPTASIQDHLQHIEVIAPSGQALPVSFPNVLAHIVDRSAFDRALAGQASTAGASVWTAAVVRALRVAKEAVHLTVMRNGSSISVRARAVVLASGPRYQFQQQLGMGGPSRYLKTVQVEVEQPMATPLRVFLGRKISPGSFAWWLPVRQGRGYRVKIGVTVIDGSSQAAFRAFLELLRRRGELEPDGLTARGWMIPIAPLSKTYSDRVVAVGDAAGQTKPTTGGGLYYGLLCARIAAEVIANGIRRRDLSSRSLAEYERRWRHVLRRELAAASRFRRLFERLSDADIDRLFAFLAQDGFMKRLERNMDFDWHRNAILQTLQERPLAGILLGGALRSQAARWFD